MEHITGCRICGKELSCRNHNERLTRYYCDRTFEAEVHYADGHDVCDVCHSSSAVEIIEKYCIRFGSADPVDLATDIMRHPSVRMRGPEHHFLVPAVLIAAYYNQRESLKVDCPCCRYR